MSEPPFEHEPVLLTRVIEHLATVPDGWCVDATVGAAGHAVALLSAHPGLRLLGLDRDADAIAAAHRALARFPDERYRLVHTRFDHLTETVHTIDSRPLTAVLFDLGVSSPQLDRADRGFSYRHPGPLDMRMDQRDDVDAGALVNERPVAELESVLRAGGEDRFARRIARAVVDSRPITSTTELADVVRSAIPAAARRRGGHPAKRTFQALRIAVNEELEVLAEGLDQALDLLAVGGRCAVLAYHSGEDRIVKRRFSAATSGPEIPAGLPVRDVPDAPFRRVTRGAEKASAAEIATNPRAESVRLRVVERTREAGS